MGGVTLILGLVLTLTAQIQKDQTAAFQALQRFQVATTAARKNPQGLWPTVAQQTAIRLKTDIAFDGIKDALPLGLDLVPGHAASPQVVSMLRNAAQAVADLQALVTPLAPTAVRTAVRALVDAYAVLLADFPTTGRNDLDDHP